MTMNWFPVVLVAAIVVLWMVFWVVIAHFAIKQERERPEPPQEKPL